MKINKDTIDEYKVRVKNFFDLKYRWKRWTKKLAIGELDRVPVSKAVAKDIDEFSYNRMGGVDNNFTPEAIEAVKKINPDTRIGQESGKMKYIKTKSGRVIVTPASIRQIRELYPDAEIVDAPIK